MTRTWEDNAAEFAALDQGEGWPFAVLIAASVEKGAGQSERGSRRSDRNDEKVSAQRFAEVAATSAGRVLRYLDAWERAADMAIVVPAANLTPDDVHAVELPDVPFKTFYDASQSGGRQYGNVATAVNTIEKRGAAAVVAALTDEQKTEVAREVIRQAPVEQFRQIQRDADDRHDRDHQHLNEIRKTSRARQEAEHRSRHTLRYVQVDGFIDDAKRKLRDALNEAQGVEFDAEERDLLAEEIKRVRNLADLLDMLITGTTEVDWDAELERIGGAR